MKVTEEQDVSGIEVCRLKEVPEHLQEMYEKAYQDTFSSQEGFIRFCMDVCAVNAIPRKDAYPLTH